MTSIPVLSANKISRTFSDRPLFHELSLAIHDGERVAILGPNGSGKSTLLKIFAGLDEPDQGTVSRRRGLRCAYASQQDLFPAGCTVGEVIERALEESGHDHTDSGRRVSITLGELGLNDKDLPVDSLSGGWKKRLAIARCLAHEPEVLLLDEPTNHLDIDAIVWLEGYLSSRGGTILFVSHDRYFIERMATRVVEINRRYTGGTFETDGGYSDFLERRSDFLETQRQTRASLANKVRREVEWLRQGVKARGTKSKARISEAHSLINELQSMKVDSRQAGFEFATSKRKTKELINIEKISKSFGDKKLFWDLSLILTPGTRLGISGPNGSGKSTLVQTLLGALSPDSGRVTIAKGLKISYFDQARRLLDPEQTLKSFLAPHGDSVHFNGENIHVAAWAARFLFDNAQLSRPLGSLSGGEQARALLSALMLQESDILMFDEPTNDLDIPTLEVLEESFDDFPGAIVLVTHDRFFLGRVASSIIGLGNGLCGIFGDLAQWEAALAETRAREDGGRRSAKGKRQDSTTRGKTKLSYQEDRELGRIQGEIERAEARVTAIENQLASPEVVSDATTLTTLCSDLKQAQQEVEQLYSRWQELESLRESLSR